MTNESAIQDEGPDGDAFLRVMSALSNPHRLRILAALGESRQYVSELARQIGMSRPLLHMHLRKLEGAGLIVGSIEVSDDGKAMRYYEVQPFALQITPETIAHAAQTLKEDQAGESDKGDA